MRCFVDKKGMNNQIADKLGVGFSQPPFATVVVGSLPCLPLPSHLLSLAVLAHVLYSLSFHMNDRT